MDIGLYTILVALGIGQGDEVITTPWTMCATATTIVGVGATPVFADIQLDTYCIDPDTVYPLITNRTKAILAVDIFGYSCDYSSLRKIADDHNLLFITDSARCIAFMVINTSSLSDIGGFSLITTSRLIVARAVLLLLITHILHVAVGSFAIMARQLYRCQKTGIILILSALILDLVKLKRQLRLSR